MAGRSRTLSASIPYLLSNEKEKIKSVVVSGMPEEIPAEEGDIQRDG